MSNVISFQLAVLSLWHSWETFKHSRFEVPTEFPSGFSPEEKEGKEFKAEVF